MNRSKMFRNLYYKKKLRAKPIDFSRNSFI